MCIFIMQRLEEKRKYRAYSIEYRVKTKKSTIRKRRYETKNNNYSISNYSTKFYTNIIKRRGELVDSSIIQ